MTKKSIEVHITDGPDARPVAVLVQVASQYESQIYVDYRQEKIERLLQEWYV